MVFVYCHPRLSKARQLRRLQLEHGIRRLRLHRDGIRRQQLDDIRRGFVLGGVSAIQWLSCPCN